MTAEQLRTIAIQYAVQTFGEADEKAIQAFIKGFQVAQEYYLERLNEKDNAKNKGNDRH